MLPQIIIQGSIPYRFIDSQLVHGGEGGSIYFSKEWGDSVKQIWQIFHFLCIHFYLIQVLYENL